MTASRKSKLALLAGVGLTVALAWLLVAVTANAGEEGLNLPLKRYTLPDEVQPATLPTTVEISTASGVVILEGADPLMGGTDVFADNLRGTGGGDVNGDGFEDLILGSPGANPGGRLDAGKVHIVFGRSPALPTPIVVSDLADVIIEGIDDHDLAGENLANGDVDGDGYHDVIISARWADPGGRVDAGEVYVVYGSSDLSGTVVLSTATNVAILEGVDGDPDGAGPLPGDWAGWGLTSGDVDGDGFDDVIISAPTASPGGRFFAGELYVVYGRNRLTGRHQISTTADVLILESVDDWDLAGAPVVSGDLDRDGYDDVVIGASFADPGGRTDAGEVYVVYNHNRLTGTHQISTTTDVAILEGVDDGDRAGAGLGSGDVNGDGRHDLVIGAPLADPGGRIDAGETYVLYSQSHRLSGTLQISTTSNVAILEGVDDNDWAGHGVCRDTNNDRFADILIDAYKADPGGRTDAGEVYVVYGSADISGTIQISNPGSVMVSTIQGVDDGDEALGTGVVDLNNDKGGEIIVSAFLADPGGRLDAGEVYVIYSFPDKYWLNLPVVLKGYSPPGLVNGDFEGEAGWTFGGSMERHIISTDMPHSGSRSALLGGDKSVYNCEGGIPIGSAWMEQTFNVPDEGSPALSFWYRLYSYHMARYGARIDSFEVKIDSKPVFEDILDWATILGCDFPSPNDRGWRQETLDLSTYKGKTITLRFEVWNRAHNWYNTWAYVDNVSLQ